MTLILGISAFYHDSAAVLLQDGQIVAAAQEERFSRLKHDKSFPKQSISFCLERAGVTIDQIDYVVFYEKPLLKFERLLETWVGFAPWGYRSFRRAVPEWVHDKLRTPQRIRQALETLSGHGSPYAGPLVYTEHHESHAASAFFPSPFEEAAILTVDGVGEWATTCVGLGRGNRIELQQEIRFPHSLGLLYSAFTYYLGFRVNSGEYKLMGLAPFGKPTYRDLIREHLVDVKPDGSFRLDMKYFNYCQGLTMTSAKFDRLLGGPPRKPESEITSRHMDLAASIQVVLEDIMLTMSNYAYETTGMTNLVMAGGVALNCACNGRLQREGPFDRIWVQPAAGDAGGALGAAQFVYHQLLERERPVGASDGQQGSLLGPSFEDDAIRAALREARLEFSSADSDEELCAQVAEQIDEQKTVGWFQGRMEFGPRALGSRSILGDARNPEMQSLINQKIKFRESFRPFAPIVLKDHAAQYFEVTEAESPYMMFVAPVTSRSTEVDDEAGQPQNASASSIPAVTHVDGSARLQTVDAARNPLLYRLLQAFQNRTGCAVMINTSFNVRGEPIVCSPSDAIECFLMTDMEVLVLARHIVQKNLQDPLVLKQEAAERAIELDNAMDSKSHLMRPNWAPESKQLRWFGWLTLGVLLILTWRFSSHPTLSRILASVGILAACIGSFLPQALRPVYVGCMLLLMPIGWIVGELLMLLFYLGLLLPLSILFRLMGRDELSLKPGSEGTWRDRRQREPSSYYRQF